MFTQTWVLVAFIFLISPCPFVRSQGNPYSCKIGVENSMSNPIYESNRNRVLSSLSQNIDYNGFNNASLGENPNRANANVLCRGDTQLDICRACVGTAALEMVSSCPNRTEAVIYYESCTLRHSNKTIFGILENNTEFIWFNINNATSTKFLEDHRTLLEDLIFQAAGGGSLRKVTFENQTIYALVQCTPDLSSDDCTSCLTEAAVMPQFCMTKIGCRILRPSCNIRYEIYPFYNDTRLQELMVPATVPPTPAVLPPPSPQGKDKSKNQKIIILFVSISGCLLLAICGGILLRNRLRQKPKEELDIVDELSSEMSSIESLQYDVGEIRTATNNFSDDNKLGQGGFGSVYKGELLTGRKIAVKRLSKNSWQGGREFMNEVSLVARLQHRNLVRLLGFSIEGSEKLLVYEYVHNGSLDHFLFDPVKGSHLGWEVFYKIIGGIAKGLLYLHEDSRLKIVHRDLKASNILLDGEMNPKIADSGLAKLFVSDEIQGNTNRIVGT